MHSMVWRSFWRSVLWGAALAAPLACQVLQVVSEFQRYSPDGKVLVADQVQRPREIISPAVARNGFATFRIVVQPPAGATYNLFIAQNPDGILQARLYQERYIEAGDTRVPDGLSDVPQSLSSSLVDQTAQTYLLDLFVPEKAPLDRVRVEIQLNIGENWIIYPLEVRVSQPVVRNLPESWATWKEYLCGGKPRPTKAGQAAPKSLAAIAQRNLQQDLALLRQREQTDAEEFAQNAVARAAGHPNLKAYCEAGGSPRERGPEWPLRARDYLIQGLPIR